MIHRLTPDGLAPPCADVLAAEAPLQLHMVLDGPDGDPTGHPLGLTLRTPGHDRELAVGYAFAEGLLEDITELRTTQTCATDDGHSGTRLTLFVTPRGEPGRRAELLGQRRRLAFSQSGCGLCGSAELATLTRDLPALPDTPLDPTVLWAAANHPQEEATLFRDTGAVHSACLFDARGNMVLCREDVGRHNALDKLVGALLLEGGLAALQKAAEGLVLVSGRAGWELVQKCLRAGLPCLAARGAPSHLAVELARHKGMLLAGFLRPRTLNLYSGAGRLQAP